jgi:hypothetical protein
MADKPVMAAFGGERWLTPGEAVKLIQHHLGASLGRSQALLKRARASGEVRCFNDDGIAAAAKFDWAYNKADLLDWLHYNTTQPPQAKQAAQDHKRQRAEEAIKALWPKGAPSPAVLTHKPFCNAVRDWIKADCGEREIPYTMVSDDTILRAASRK